MPRLLLLSAGPSWRRVTARWSTRAGATMPCSCPSVLIQLQRELWRWARNGSDRAPLGAGHRGGPEPRGDLLDEVLGDATVGAPRSQHGIPQVQRWRRHHPARMDSGCRNTSRGSHRALTCCRRGIVRLIVQRVPGHARSVPGGIREVGVGMIDQGTVIRVPRDRRAAALGKQVAVERAHPAQVLRLFPRVQPARGACDVEDGCALGRGGRIRWPRY